MVRRILFALVILGAAPGVVAGEPRVVTPAVHENLNRALDGLAGQVHGLGDRWRDHFTRGESPAERPLISLMLSWRQELGLSTAQVESLERLRTEFQREATRRDADIRAAETALAGLLQAEPVDLASAEAKVRDIERQRADLRLGRIRTIEQGRAQLTPEQRAKLSTLLATSAPRRLGVSTPGAGPR